MNTKLYHGTARALGVFIEKEGLKPEGCPIVPEEFRKSCYSEPGYIYFTDKLPYAEFFACGVTKQIGLGNQGQIFEIDTNEIPVEKDPLLPRNSFRVKGTISPEKIKTIKIFKCSEEVMDEVLKTFKK